MAPRALGITDTTVDRKCMFLVIDNSGFDVSYESIAVEKFGHTEIRTTVVQKAKEKLRLQDQIA